MLSYGDRGLKGVGFIIQCFEHLGTIAPKLRDPEAFFFPIAMRWGDNQVLRARRHPPGIIARSLLKDLTKVTWRPFNDLIFLDLERLALVKHLSKHRVLFRGMWGDTWCLGERIVPQWSDIEPRPSPNLPPPTMHCPEIIPSDEIKHLGGGVWDDLFLD
ncbi:uncharacterized protein LOC122067656 [Macadamia integrifolia]|uniref:uncharacterized protein LOC122067656 n=1 Tax=Macadamia integrifolia TaxID=60698 RepID=UPI001C4E601E|nr:uncharacterized protein LOC122067656 [Macadamia integrifolia]